MGSGIMGNLQKFPGGGGGLGLVLLVAPDRYGHRIVATAGTGKAKRTTEGRRENARDQQRVGGVFVGRPH